MGPQRNLYRFLLCLTLLLFAGCAPKSEEDFKKAGRRQCRQVLALLEQIESPNHFASREKGLRKQFLEMELLIERGSSFLEKGGSRTEWGHTTESELLLFHLKRVYSLPGGRAFIESCQRPKS